VTVDCDGIYPTSHVAGANRAFVVEVSTSGAGQQATATVTYGGRSSSPVTGTSGPNGKIRLETSLPLADATWASAVISRPTDRICIVSFQLT
jgi:hypothetical protein